jgi:hypothetical protein
VCMNSNELVSEQVVVLKPINSGSEGIKLAILKTGQQKALAFEYRTGGAQNSLGPQDYGVLVYSVDSTLGFEGGITQLAPQSTSRYGIGRSGDSFEAEGYVISIGEVNTEEAYVQIVQKTRK